MKRSIIALMVAGTFAVTAQANSHNSDNTWKDDAMDAWIDGKAEATLLFNGNLNSFKINTDVKDGKVVLTGNVESSVDKKLAEELVEGIEGVRDVDNELTVLTKGDMSGDKTVSTALTDAKIATVVKSRLLFDTDISGMNIDVDVDKGTVMLKGEVESEAQKDLAIQIAQNATDVRDVEADLNIVSESE